MTTLTCAQAEIAALPADQRQRLEPCLPKLRELLGAYDEGAREDDVGIIAAFASATSGIVIHAKTWELLDHLRERLPEGEVMAAISETLEIQPPTLESSKVLISGLSVYLGPEGRAFIDERITQLRTLDETPLVVVLVDRVGELTTIAIRALPLQTAPPPPARVN
jgi:hypothetical protein